MTSSSIIAVIENVLKNSIEDSPANGVLGSKSTNQNENSNNRQKRPLQEVSGEDEDWDEEDSVLHDQSQAHSPVFEHISSSHASYDSKKIPVLMITKEGQALVRRDLNRLDLLAVCRKRIDSDSFVVSDDYTDSISYMTMIFLLNMSIATRLALNIEVRFELFRIFVNSDSFSAQCRTNCFECFSW